MENLGLNPEQKKVIPNLLAFFGALVSLIGLFTPWLSLGGNGLSGTNSTQGKLTYLVILTLAILGISAFIESIQKYTRIISIITILVCAEVIVSHAIWLFQVLRAIHEFDSSVSDLDNLGGIFGSALANITQSFKPTIASGFYMVLIGAILGLISGLMVFLNANSFETENFFTTKSILRVEFVAVAVLAILGLVAVIALSGTSSLDESLNKNQSASNSQTSSTKVSSSHVFDCLKVKNVGNSIRLNQPSFSGDPEPTDIFVATKFKFVNTCGKTISGIKGNVDFQDVVGDLVFTGGYTDDNTIKTGESFSTSLNTGWTFNEFEDEYGQLAGMDQNKTLAVLVLTKVVFSDGSSISE